MSPERWRRIEELYEAALELAPAERSAFLGDECGDDDLKQAVERLLAQDSRRGILDASAAQLITDSMEALDVNAPIAAISPGSTVGPYEIIARIGAGGMGTVFKARDTRIGRLVAIKFVDGQFFNRFQREARALATLNHPHIATLYDVGPNYLVMEYVEGSPIHGPMPFDEALRLALQLLDAIDAAHRYGIVHRDLKPANLLLVKSGIKVLDFGIAKMRTGLENGDETLTKRGSILGTLHYMSPEQLQGKEVDSRSDLFSFGVVLYELLTGRRAFGAENSANVIASILSSEPRDLGKLHPPGLDRILRRCLAKDPSDRWQSASDLKVALEWLPSFTAASPVPRAPRRWIWVAAGLFAIAIVIAAIWFPQQHDSPTAALEFAIPPPEGSSFADPAVGPVGYISPDGRVLLAVVWRREGSSISLRRLDSRSFVPVAGTDGVITSAVAWSPDSQHFAFVSKDGKLSSVPLDGGRSRLLAESVSTEGITWGQNGDLIATDLATQRLVLFPASGGSMRLLSELDKGRGETAHIRPQFLPGGRRYLYLGVSRDRTKSAIFAASLDNAEQVPLVGIEQPALFVPSRDRRWLHRTPGWLLTGEKGRLYARLFDPSKLRISGEKFTVTDQVDWGANGSATSISVSNNGVMVINPPFRIAATPTLWTRDGQSTSPAFPDGAYGVPVFSHDGKRLVLQFQPPNAPNQDVWIFSLNGSALTRITSGPEWFGTPIWSPDDRAVFYTTTEGKTSQRATYRQDIDKISGPVRVLPPYGYTTACQISADGRRMLLAKPLDAPHSSLLGIWLVPFDHPEQGRIVADQNHWVVYARLSPDERFIVFSAQLDDTEEIYIQTLDAPQPRRWRVSEHGGRQPHWSHDGREIFYLGADGKVMVAAVSVKGDEVRLATPKALFSHPPLLPTYAGYQYDVNPTGDRFVFTASGTGKHLPPVRVVVQWESLLNQ
jgi:serine/threonine protein kinase